jgi:DNA repair protein RecN (Recombination protein N)
MDDISKELESAAETVHSDPELLERMNQQLQQIYYLQKKHQVTSIAALLQIQNELKERVHSVSHLEDALTMVQTKIQQQKAILDTLGNQIHQQRITGVPLLIQKIEAVLQELGMPNARFKIDLIQQDQYFKNGKDAITFLFSANKGGDFGLLRKVASGGELARIMLAVKAILAENSQLPTLILDEIDTGVSGEIAHRMGEIMRKMSTTMQVFAITHLPQIAGKGRTHFRVYKEVVADATVSHLKQLSSEERIQEIAQMLSGNSITAAALGQARELLN